MRLLVILIGIIPALSFGQIISADFENNNLNDWYENIPSRWQINSQNPINGNSSLTHAYNSPDAGVDWIAFIHKPLDLDKASTIWEFSIRYDYNPSSSNNWSIFLSATDLPDKYGDIEEGVIFGVNYKGNNDEIAFWLKKSNETTCIYSTGFNWQENVTPGQTVSFRIERVNTGRILISINTTLKGFSLIGETDSVELKVCSSFLLYYKYTSNYDQGLSFDDLKISGSFLNDSISPEVSFVRILSQNKIEIEFSETVRLPDNVEFCIEGIGCKSINGIISKNLQIELPHPLVPGNNYKLKLPFFKDLTGNSVTSDKQEFIFYYPKAFDIVINEIMPDPDPSVFLPEVEYIELYNRTKSEISLNDWHLFVNKKTVLVPSYQLGPEQYLVLCNSEIVNQFNIDQINILGIEGFPLISNENCDFVLSDVSNSMIHAVQYSSDWYTLPDKKEGGWSIELVNPNEPCIDYGNWKESDDFRGGTPGIKNSTLDFSKCQVFPELYRASFQDSRNVVLYFSEPLDSNSIVYIDYFFINQGIGSPDSILPSTPFCDKLTLYFTKVFLPDVIYNISLTSDITDCSGNTFSEQQTADILLPEIAEYSDLVINEIMYNPAEGCEEYIELYNNSTKTIDLKDWFLSIGDTSENYIKITDEHFLIIPQDFIIISKSFPENIPVNELSYRKKLLFMPGLKSLSNNGSSISLFNEDHLLIDLAIYSPDSHHQITESTKGISLERISANKSGCDSENWQSASSDAGYKTPASENSQHFNEYNIGNKVILSPYTITPNNDGIDDFLNINYRLENPGLMGRILVFDINGNMKYSILNGGILGTSGNFKYDGTDNNGNKLLTGYYILFFEVYSSEKKVYKTKQTFVIANTE